MPFVLTPAAELCRIIASSNREVSAFTVHGSRFTVIGYLTKPAVLPRVVSDISCIVLNSSVNSEL